MTRNEVFSIIKTNAAIVLSIDPAKVLPDCKLVDLGANSIDRMEIVTMTMEALAKWVRRSNRSGR